MGATVRGPEGDGRERDPHRAQPFTPEFLDLADQMGFLVMNEAFDEWKAGKVPQGYNVYFDEWAERDLTEFVQRDRNHPSVVLWSAGNEIPEQVRPDGHLVLKRLQDIIHREDPSRLVTTGNDRIRAGNGPARLEFLEMVDVVGYNYVDRWNERRERYAADDRHAHPNWKMIGTESSSLSGTRGGYSLGPDSSVPRADYTARMMRPEQLWKFVSLNDYYAGDFMWTGIDYLGESQWPSKGRARDRSTWPASPRTRSTSTRAAGRRDRCCTSSRTGTGRGARADDPGDRLHQLSGGGAVPERALAGREAASSSRGRGTTSSGTSTRARW